MTTPFITWWCKAGHELTAHEEAVEVWCPLAGHKRTNAMRIKSLYPHWGPQHPVECGWCHKQMEKGDPSLPVSHSICSDCEKKHFPAEVTA